jgi:tenascin
MCLKDCNGRGRCMNGICECSEMFTGLSCEKIKCKNECMGNGDCI